MAEPALGEVQDSWGFWVGLPASGHMSAPVFYQSRALGLSRLCVLVLGLADDEQVRDSQSYRVRACLETNKNKTTTNKTVLV